MVSLADFKERDDHLSIFKTHFSYPLDPTSRNLKRPRKRFAYESPIEEFYYDRSVVPMEKPLGKMEIEAMIQAAVEQTNTGGN